MVSFDEHDGLRDAYRADPDIDIGQWIWKRATGFRERLYEDITGGSVILPVPAMLIGFGEWARLCCSQSSVLPPTNAAGWLR